MSTTIECRPNGPYVVKGEPALENSKGEAIAAEAVIFLCRCGGSANKPFCDGTHKRNGFSDARLSDGGNDRVKSYRAGTIVIHDNRSLCSHVGYCTDGLPAVFRDDASPWIDPGGASAAAILETVRKCPSGALSCEIDGAPAPQVARPPTITVSKDGPYMVTGSVALADARWGQGASPEHYTLCRCGASKNKPFCDGSHWDARFTDDRN
jgi:CDGSH-type Zn-finger protein